jgi:5'-nucleotidase
MNKMGYDCATIGNHDFDGGLDNLALQISHAKFPFVNCNYDFSNTPLAGKINKHVVLQKGKLKIGITGVGVELDGLVPAQLFGNTVYNNPIEAVQKEAAILKYDHKCNLIICLSHLGYKYEDSKVSDLVLGASTSNIDLIIGGHTHTFLPEPVVIKNKKNEDVIINQVGWAGVQLGQLNYLFEKKLRKKIANTHTVVEIKKSSVK